MILSRDSQWPTVGLAGGCVFEVVSEAAVTAVQGTREAFPLLRLALWELLEAVHVVEAAAHRHW